MSTSTQHDDESEQELSRRTFMANAVVTLGGVIGFGLAVPLVTSLMPAADALEQKWSPLSAHETARLRAATTKPVKVFFNLHSQDGYYPASDVERFFWAIAADEATMRGKRPELFAGAARVPYPVVNFGFVVFSPICPHLGCPYEWHDEKQRFHCPCHGSEYSEYGEHLDGPARRGLDPLPLREHDGIASITWIEYKQGAPDRLIVSYG